MKQSFKLSTVDRLIAIMSYIASADMPRNLTEIAKHLGLSKASTYRILYSLEKGQWVVRNPETNRYSVGYRILELGQSLLANLNIKTISIPHLTKLRDVTGETVGLSIRVGNERMFIEEMQSEHNLRYITPIWKRFPLWGSAGSKVILANMSEDEIAVILNELKHSGVHRLASGQVLDIDELNRELGTIKRQGFAISREERELGTAAVAAAIFNNENEVVGAISIAGPVERLSNDVLEKYGVLVIRVGEEITRQMGGWRSQ